MNENDKAIKCLDLKVYKYPEHKFPHEKEIFVTYWNESEASYKAMTVHYPAIRDPEKYNSNYFIMTSLSDEKINNWILKCKNLTWCYIEDIKDGMTNMFKN